MNTIVIGFDIYYFTNCKEDIPQVKDDKYFIENAIKCAKKNPFDIALFPSTKSFIEGLNSNMVDTENMFYYQVECSDEDWEKLHSFSKN